MDNNYTTFLEELRSKSNIVEVARRYVDLERKGSKYWARCPIHNEKTPSFTLNEELGLYHCFGCGASGDVFSFIQAVEHCDFKDAVKMLAERAGMQVPEYKAGGNQTKRDEERRYKERLYDLMRDSAKYYYANLKTTDGREAREYAEQRGLSKSTLTTFGIGCSLGYDGLINHLREKGYTDKEMLDSGVAAEKNGKLYDFEAGRFIVPIFNNTNNVVAFGGRVLGKADFMKYKNTSETVIFSKRRELFGVHTLKKAKLTEKFSCVIVVEGYMDVISLYQAGIRNVCASMGTALTAEQAKQLKYYNNNIYLCYDGDSAGQNATYKGIDVLRDAGLNVKVITLIDDLDPDDLIKKYGVDKFKELIQNAISPTEYKIRTIAKAHDLSTPEGQGKFAVEALDVLSELSTIVEREAYLPMIAEMSKLDISSLKKQLYSQPVKAGGYSETRQIEQIFPALKTNDKMSVTKSKYYKAVRHVIYTIFNDNTLGMIEDNLVPFFEDKEHIQIYDYARELAVNNEPLTLDKLRELEDNSEAKTIADGQYAKIDINLREKMLEDCLRSLKLSYYEMQQEELTSQMPTEANSEEGRRIRLLISENVLKINELKRGGNNGR